MSGFQNTDVWIHDNTTIWSMEISYALLNLWVYGFGMNNTIANNKQLFVFYEDRMTAWETGE